MVTIKKLEQFELEYQQFFGFNGFKTNKIYIVEKQKLDDEVMITINIKQLEEIYEKEWSIPKQLTHTKNKKLYLNTLKDNDISHLTWSEFINENYIIKYMKLSHDETLESLTNFPSLSKPSNCSLPTFIKTGDVLWNVWVQMDRLFNNYSLDNGNSWSTPKLDEQSLNVKFIRYKYSSNYKGDITRFNLNNVFGTYNPQISFIGFKNVKSKS